MHRQFCFLGLALLLSGCGQSGALLLPSAQNQDQPTQYLLYKQSKKTENTPQKQTEAADAAASAVQAQP